MIPGAAVDVESLPARIPVNWIKKKIAQERPQLKFALIANISEWINVQGQKSLKLRIDWVYASACEVEIWKI